jgi:hypothetical protein
MKTFTGSFLYITLLIFFLVIPKNHAQLYKLETKNSKIIYWGKTYDYLVPHVGAAMESAFAFHKNYWDYSSDNKISIFLNDFSDIGNGGAMTIPRNMIMVGISPFDFTFDVMPANERFQWLMNHELTHIVMADKPADSDIFFRNVFGGKVGTDNENPLSMFYSYLTTPRWYSPRWFHEGIAVFMETWMSGSLGRVLGGYDEMVFRAMTKENSYFYQPIGLETEGTTVDFQVGVNSYLYGTRFISYLSSVYGMDKVHRFYNRTPESSKFYAAQFEDVFGTSIVNAWDEWVQAEKKFQKTNLDAVNSFPLTEKNEFTDEILGSVSRPYFIEETKEIIAAINRPGDLASLVKMNINTGEIKKIGDVESPGLYYVTNFAFDEANNRIFATMHNQNWRGLKTIDLNSGDEEVLFDYIRISELVYSKSEKAIYGIQVFNGRTSVVKLSGDFKNVERLYSIPFGYSFFDIDVSPNGPLLSGTFANTAGNQKLMIFNLDSLNLGKIDTTTIYEFEENSASNFVFCKDGKNLIGTSYYTGISNVWQINIENKSAELMTNADIGFFRPIEISKDSLLVMEYKVKGLKPVKVKKEYLNYVQPINYFGMKALEKNPELYNYIPQPSSELNNNELITYEGPYNPFTETDFENAYPILEGYKDFLAYGFQINLSDDLLLSKAKIKAAYSHNQLLRQKERIHLSLSYNYWDWEFNAGLNKTNFYDLFGPTKVSRAGYHVSIGYTHNIKIEKPIDSKIRFTVAHYGDLEKLPQYQNVNAGFTKLSLFAINYHYSKFNKSLGAVEYEDGYKFSANLETAYFSKYFAPVATAQFEKAFLIPGIRNSSIWLRASGGRVFADTKTSFDKIYFGGFGNNYVDRLEVHQYRNIESFPGRKINELGGKDFAKLGVEWNLPPVMFRELGFLSAYVRFARLSLFQDNLITDVSDEMFRSYHHNIGTQLDFEIVFFSLLKSTLSFGYARAFNQYSYPADEFMISLKLL